MVLTQQMTEDEIQKANEKAIELATGGLGINSNSFEVFKDYQSLIEEKEKRNEESREAIRKNKLRGGRIFQYTLISIDEKLVTLNITYPPTSKAMKYQRFLINPETSKLELFFTDIVEDFKKDKLIQKFNIDDYELSEITELAGFLSAVIQNPRLK